MMVNPIKPMSIVSRRATATNTTQMSITELSRSSLNPSHLDTIRNENQALLLRSSCCWKDLLAVFSSLYPRRVISPSRAEEKSTYMGERDMASMRFISIELIKYLFRAKLNKYMRRGMRMIRYGMEMQMRSTTEMQ